MRRRSLLVGAGAVAGYAALGALAESGAPLKRLGCLWPQRKTDRTIFVLSFEARLRELGWIEGKNLIIVNRYADLDSSRYEAIARELAAGKPDVIHALFTSGVRAVQKAAPNTPIVFSIVSDPVAEGLVASLARPGGNITGASTREAELFLKRIQLVRELLPKASRVAVLVDKAGQQSMPPLTRRALTNMADVGRQLGLTVEEFTVGSVDDVGPVFQHLVKARFDAVMVVLYLRVNGKDRAVVTAHAEQARLPAIYMVQDYVDLWGGLIAYNQNLAELARRAAGYVDKILRGARPADLPVEEPNVFELVINLKAARAIGVTIPPLILLRADRVIE